MKVMRNSRPRPKTKEEKKKTSQLAKRGQS